MIFPTVMAEIVLTTLNAKYIHASFGLRYLLANLGELRERACLLEFDINQKPLDMIVEPLKNDDSRGDSVFTEPKIAFEVNDLRVA